MVKTAFLSFFVRLVISATAFAHPTDGLTPNDLPAPYGRTGGGLPASWSINDLLFIYTYPAPETLTDQEKYMIAGAKDSVSDIEYLPWEYRVKQLVERYYRRFGVIPDALNPEVIANAYGLENPNDLPYGILDELVSPLTGRYPRLDAVNHSPGDLFIQVLTEQEKAHIAAQSKYNYDLWYNSEHYSALTQKWEYKDTQSVIVMYIRTYGWNDIIHTSLSSSYISCDEE